MRTPTQATGVLLVALTGCTSSPEPGPAPRTSPSTSPTTARPAALAEGSVVRFSGADGASVDVTLGAETPTTRDFLSLVPFTTTLEEYAGREKTGDPPRRLDVGGTPGSDPEDGELIYSTPWGNLGFYYDASGVEFSGSTPHLGTYAATAEELSALEGQTVTVEVVP